jgi:ABC-type glycerol-3-phosphate transport system permease component
MRLSFRRRHWKTQLGVYVGVLAVIAFFSCPILWMISTSFKRPVEFFTFPPRLVPEDPTVENYTGVLTADFLRYFLNSFIAAGGTSVLALMLAILASYSFARVRFRGRNSLLALLLVSQLVPLALLLIPIYRLAQDLDLINTYGGLIVAYLTFTLPVAVWLLYGFVAAIPTELEEAAMIDGRSELGAFLHVTMPLALPGLAATGAFVFFAAWQDFMFALVFMTSDEKLTLPLGVLTFIGEHSVDWGKLMAASMLLMVPIFVLFALVQRQFIQGLTAGAVKG